MTKEPEGMDPSAQEHFVGKPHVNQPRVCYGIKTLVGEVLELFPKTIFETSEPNDRNVDLAVTFVIDDPWLADVLLLIEPGARVDEIFHDGENKTLKVHFRNSARTQDSREPFGLAEALEILEDEMDRES